MEEIKNRRTKFIVLQSIFASIVIILSILALLYRPEFLIFIVIFAILWLIASLLGYHHYIKLPYKMMIVQPTIENIRNGIKYNYIVTYEMGYKEIIKKYKLFPLAKKFNFNDEIKDIVDENSYTSFDLIASHQVSSGKSTRTVIDFQGKVYDIELGETYCDYILKQDGKKINPDGFTKLDLESIEMNEKFDLYATDIVETVSYKH
ncbi:MAG: hypothetical protein K2K50_00345, partial [Anaeroplasmataceae bacterium]|nr:hypothetical protein [Anaeroplasmataceae bacterium]